MDIQATMQALQRRGFVPHLCKNGAEAVELAKQLIPVGSKVGIGGSLTVKQIGLDQALFSDGRTVYSHATVSKEQQPNLWSLARSGEWYISSVNAMTADGDLLNIDGTANRVSSLIFGVANILYVVGINKIAPDLNAAIERARNIAAPLNARRLQRNVPCAETGVCSYCDCPECICNTTVIVHHPTRVQKSVHVILIEEELGL